MGCTRIRRKGERQTRPLAALSRPLFQHRTSRSHDPQLHTHAVIINATKRQRQDLATPSLTGPFLLPRGPRRDIRARARLCRFGAGLCHRADRKAL
ncbi:relaxase domain-containing protein [Sphingobium sp.]|uniref:relaxase domain-containing protein n=1 Tax=Sphingobium sp. TaxID=1912891 RepID=UPI0039C8E83B